MISCVSRYRTKNLLTVWKFVTAPTFLTQTIVFCVHGTKCVRIYNMSEGSKPHTRHPQPSVESFFRHLSRRPSASRAVILLLGPRRAPQKKKYHPVIYRPGIYTLNSQQKSPVMGRFVGAGLLIPFAANRRPRHLSSFSWGPTTLYPSVDPLFRFTSTQAGFCQCATDKFVIDNNNNNNQRV